MLQKNTIQYRSVTYNRKYYSFKISHTSACSMSSISTWILKICNNVVRVNVFKGHWLFCNCIGTVPQSNINVIKQKFMFVNIKGNTSYE